MSDGFRPQPAGYATKAIHVSQSAEQWNSMAVVPPITTSTTFKQDEPGEHCVSFFLFLIIIRNTKKKKKMLIASEPERHLYIRLIIYVFFHSRVMIMVAVVIQPVIYLKHA